MGYQSDDMRNYIRLTESSPSRIREIDDVEDWDGDDIFDDSVDIEDIKDMIFKFRSFIETSGSEDYKVGVENGLALAANMLESLLERQSSNSSK